MSGDDGGRMDGAQVRQVPIILVHVHVLVILIIGRLVRRLLGIVLLVLGGDARHGGRTDGHDTLFSRTSRRRSLAVLRVRYVRAEEIYFGRFIPEDEGCIGIDSTEEDRYKNDERSEDDIRIGNDTDGKRMQIYQRARAQIRTA